MKSGQGAGLTFHWPDHRHISFLLPGFIALSVLLHALAFYIFQVVYPPSVSITPPPAQVSLLVGSKPEYRSLLRWIEAEDPATVLRPPEVVPENLFDLPYKPSYAQIHASPKVVPADLPPLPLPPPQDALAIINSAVPKPENVVRSIPALDTTLKFSGALATRGAKEPPALVLPRRTETNLVPARFMVGVTDRGEVRYTFLQETSGDKTMDQQAQAHLTQLQFAPSAQAMTWGFATYAWGNDAYAASPKSALRNPQSK